MNDEDDSLSEEQYRRILAEAECIAGMFTNASYPLLAKHTSSAQRAALAIEIACAMRLTEALRDTAVIRNRSEAVQAADGASLRPEIATRGKQNHVEATAIQPGIEETPEDDGQGEEGR